MIDFNAADPDAPYDPDPLAAGDRVRVRLSGECQGWGHQKYSKMPHGSVEDGAIGIVEGIVPQNERFFGDGHPYAVQYPGRSWPSAFFARVELERIP